MGTTSRRSFTNTSQWVPPGVDLHRPRFRLGTSRLLRRAPVPSFASHLPCGTLPTSLSLLRTSRLGVPSAWCTPSGCSSVRFTGHLRLHPAPHPRPLLYPPYSTQLQSDLVLCTCLGAALFSFPAKGCGLVHPRSRVQCQVQRLTQGRCSANRIAASRAWPVAAQQISPLCLPLAWRVEGY